MNACIVQYGTTLYCTVCTCSWSHCSSVCNLSFFYCYVLHVHTVHVHTVHVHVHTVHVHVLYVHVVGVTVLQFVQRISVPLTQLFRSVKTPSI